MNRSQFLAAFNKKTKREQLKLIEILAQPWIKSEAIKEVPKDINVILDLQFKSKEAERIVLNKENSNFTPKGGPKKSA